MEDSQREAMYNGWKDSNKWTTVTIEQDGDNFIATCDAIKELVIIRLTKAQAIYAIAGELSYKGYEISNLAEIQGIK